MLASLLRPRKGRRRQQEHSPFSSHRNPRARDNSRQYLIRHASDREDAYQDIDDDDVDDEDEEDEPVLPIFSAEHLGTSRPFFSALSLQRRQPICF